MKKLTMLIFLMMISYKLFAPEWPSLFIAESKAVNKYDRLVKAIAFVESRNGLFVYNAKEKAVGYLQIRQCRVDDYTQRTKSTYKLIDFYDYNLSRQMFLYYAQGKSYEMASRDWNGSGPMTKEYWKKVKLIL